LLKLKNQTKRKTTSSSSHSKDNKIKLHCQEFFDFFEEGIKNIKINNTPHPNPLLRSGEGREGKNLTTPLTFILSRKGREEKN